MSNSLIIYWLIKKPKNSTLLPSSYAKYPGIIVKKKNMTILSETEK